MALISISPWPALVGIVPDRQLAPYSCFGGVSTVRHGAVDYNLIPGSKSQN